MARLSRLLIALSLSTMALTIPTLSHAAASDYVVRSGDSLSGIAARLDVPLADLLRANNLTVSSLILPGQRLTVPGAGGGSSGGSGGTTYTVKPGDWLSRIASRNGVSLSALLQANHLTVNSVIMPGQRLTIPGTGTGGGGGGSGGGAGGAGGTTYTVKSGDWLSRIASRHGVTLSALLNANRLTATSLIMPGQVLRIPRAGGGGGAPPARPPAAPPARPPARPPSGAVGPAYTVRPGDSLGAIASHHDVTLAALLAANNLSASSLITPGMKLNLPTGARLTRVDRVINFALAQVGKPWRFFSRGPNSFDCSGLTAAAFAQIGVPLIHYSAAQALQGTKVDFLNEPIRAGDLVFQDTDGDGIINHVGIALSATTWVHARSTRLAVAFGRIPADSKIAAVRRFLATD